MVPRNTTICSVWHEYTAKTTLYENSSNVGDGREQASTAQQKYNTNKDQQQAAP